MPELAHDSAEDAFHEIQLSGKQIIFLFMTGTVVLVAVFLCGVLVGRNARSPRDLDPVETAAAAAPSSPAPTAEGAQAAAEPPAPPAEDELSYHKRLQGSSPPEEPRPAPPEQQAPAQPPPAAAPPAREAASVDVPTSGKPGTWFVQVIASQNRANAIDVVKSLIKKGYPAYLEMPAPGTPAIYRVRVGRYNERRDADQAARRLKDDKLTADVRR